MAGELLIPLDRLGNIDNPEEAVCRRIPVEGLTERFGVEAPKTLEAIRAFPTLAYLLGDVTREPQELVRIDEGPKKGQIERVHVLLEGSGMFGLRHPEDALAWKGIFNHVVGSTRGVFQGIEALRQLTDDQRRRFEDLGFDFRLLDRVTPKLAALYMLINHGGRRRMDGHNWYGLTEHPHLFDDSYPNTVVLLSEFKAHPILLALMNEENHQHLLRVGKDGSYNDMLLAIMLGVDWQWAQGFEDLHVRFEKMKAAGRLPAVMLDELKKPIIPFLQAVGGILGADFFEKITDAKGSFYRHELLIREGYAASSGLSPETFFPDFYKDL